MLKLDLDVFFTLYIYIFPHVFLASNRPSMEPREDLAEGGFGFCSAGPSWFNAKKSNPAEQM